MTAKRLLTALLLVVLASGPGGDPAQAGFIYKNYTVHDDQGQDVLCDPYVVQPNDWVYKVFRQKGEIAQSDFGEFLTIFKRINPHVGDINLLRPGQRIMIPLRKLAADSLKGQSSGTVTIPFVTIADDAGQVPQAGATHVVKPGDSVSVLIHRRFGTYGSTRFRRAVDRFKALNPQIIDINRIFIGQRVTLPEAYVDDQLLGQRLDAWTDQPPSGDSDEPAGASALETTARVFNARLRQHGDLHFPYGGNDYRLGLDRFPMLEMQGGKRFVLAGDGELAPAVAAAQAKWPDLHIVRLSAHHGAEAIIAAVAGVLSATGPGGPITFSDRGIDVSVRAKWIIADPAGTPATRRCITPLDGPGEKTPRAVVRYLARHRIIVAEFLRDPPGVPAPAPAVTAASAAVVLPADDQRALVAQLVTALGYRFSANVTVSFPYAGIQVTAASNLISTADGGAVFVDFGDFYGEAIQALQGSGVEMIQIDRGQSPAAVIQKIAATLGIGCQPDPVVWACHRAKDHNISFSFPNGFRLIGKGTAVDVLVSFATVDEQMAAFLSANGIQPIIIDQQRG